MFVRNAWYMAAFPEECTSGKPLSRTILGEKIVLFRTRQGEPVALEDRCCHRLAPLSFGDVDEGGLRCRYHGLVFDASGQCVEIPGQEQIPSSMCVRSYPLVERDGLLWIWPGDADRADPGLIVDCRLNTDPGWQTARGYLHYKADFQLIADNLLDFSHTTFVHRTTLSNEKMPYGQPEIVPFERGIRLNREIRDCEPAPLHRMAGKFPGRVDFWTRQVWWLPSVFENWAGSVSSCASDTPHEQEGGLHFRHFSLLTPETDRSTHYFWVQPSMFPHDDPATLGQVQQCMETAFQEDRWIIEAQQQVMDANPGVRPRGTRHDKALNQVRNMIGELVLQEAAKAEAA